MSAVATPRPPLFRDTRRPLGRDDAPRRRPDLPGGRPTTLEQRLERVWEGLLAKKPVTCPVCGSDGQWQRVAATHPSDPAPGGFGCTSCGTSME